MNLNLKIAAQSAQERKYYDTAGGALMKHDIPFVAMKVVAVGTTREYSIGCGHYIGIGTCSQRSA